MTSQIAVSLGLVAVAVFLLASQRWPMDSVSLLILLATILTGLLGPAEAFASFANPVVVTLASVQVLSAALFQTGLAARMGSLIVTLAGDSEPRLIAAMMIGAALLSAVMSNVAVVAVLLPVVLDISLNTGRAPSRLLLPVAYASIVGGSLSIVGTLPNVIASQSLVAAGYPALGLFAPTPVGLLITFTAISYMLIVGRRLLPGRSLERRLRQVRRPRQLIDLYRVPERIFSLEVLPNSPLVDRTLGESGLGHDYGLVVLGIIHAEGSEMSPPPTHRLRAGDRLLAQGGPRRVARASADFGLTWKAARVHEADLMSGDIGVAEVTLMPRSSLAGKSLRELHFRERFGVTVLALWRSGEPVERSISEEPLSIGDAFLVLGPWPKIRLLRNQPGLMLITHLEEIPRRTSHAPRALVILVGMLISVFAGWLSLGVASLTAALLTVFTGCLDADDARSAIDWQVVFLVAGSLTLAAAMQTSGATSWMASTFLVPLAGRGPLVMTAALVAGTALLQLVVSDYATTALLSPIALAAAVSHGLGPQGFVLAVALGSTAAVFSPLPDPALVLVMGPGNYGFRDYVRVGLPLSLLELSATWIGLALTQHF